MNELEKLYYNFHNLCEEYKDLPESNECRDEIMTYLEHNNFWGNVGVSKRQLETEELVGKALAAYEKQGFIYGFQYAMKLATSSK